MSEPKFCPFLMIGLVITKPETGGFYDCLREKCAMWRAFDIDGTPPELALALANEKRTMLGYEPLEKMPETGGYCGIAGKP